MTTFVVIILHDSLGQDLDRAQRDLSLFHDGWVSWDESHSGVGEGEPRTVKVGQAFLYLSGTRLLHSMAASA